MMVRILLAILCAWMPAADDATWDFIPAEHEKPLLDLRPLNEAAAGQHGFIGVSPDGRGFVRGDGEPIRFWPVQTGVRIFQGDEGARHARWLARLGVNLARLGGGTLNPKQPGSRIDDLDREPLENTWRGVAALKKEGVYSLLMPYWVGKGSDVTGWGIAGCTGKTDGLWGLLFFNPELQAAYRGWLRELLGRPNPHTGIPLARDPAVAVILLQNEDSLLFWTSQKLPAPQKELLGRRFAAWAIAAHGSLAAAITAWEGTRLNDDRPDDGVLDLYPIWEATQERSGGMARRIDDQVRFFTETMRDFNLATTRFLREELGCRQLIAAENWRTADQARLGDCERYAYAATEVIAKNHYAGGTHLGPRSGYRVEAGDLIAHRSVLRHPDTFPLSTRQVVGHPNIITECSWTHPNLYQSEAPFLVAAYRSLTAQAGLFWFAVGSQATWQPGISKWGAGTPMEAGQWPAAALLYRMGYVQEGPVVVHESRPLEDLWRRRRPKILEGEGYDPNRDATEREVGGPDAAGVHALAHLVGRVEVAYGAAAATRIADLRPHLDTQARVVRSATGELAWDYGRGICRLDTPCAQGVAGFLKSTRDFRFATVAITCDNDYAAILAVSLDRLPLAVSRRVLVQVGTSARPAGWRTEPAEVRATGWQQALPGERILAVGQGPWQVAATRVAMTIDNLRAPDPLIGSR